MRVYNQDQALSFFSQFGKVEVIFFYPDKLDPEIEKELDLFAGFVLFKAQESCMECLMADGMSLESGETLRMYDHETYKLLASTREDFVNSKNHLNKQNPKIGQPRFAGERPLEVEKISKRKGPKKKAGGNIQTEEIQ